MGKIHKLEKRSKRCIALALTISLVSASFSGACLYAKSQENYSETIQHILLSDLEEFAPTDNVLELKPEADTNLQTSYIDFEAGDGEELFSFREEEVDYYGIESQELISAEEIPHNELTDEKIQELVEQGYSIEDIFVAYEIANRIYQAPEEMLRRKVESGKTLEEIKEEILEEETKKRIKLLKDKYPQEFQELVNQGHSENEIVILLDCMNINRCSFKEITNGDLLGKMNTVGKEKME